MFGDFFDFDGDGSANWIDEMEMLDSMRQDELLRKQQKELFSPVTPPSTPVEAQKDKQEDSEEDKEIARFFPWYKGR